MDIILYLIQIIQYLYQQNCWLLNFICRYIPLKQWAFDDAHSPKYQKFKVDELPIVVEPLPKLSWKKIIADYPASHNGKILKPISRRKDSHISKNCSCPRCDAPVDYLYRNNGDAGQLLCKVCGTTFFEKVKSSFSSLHLKCPHCSHTLVQNKERKHFVIHKCVNPECPYYLRNLKKVEKEDLKEDYGKNKYKLHYIYREFVIDFFKFDITSLPRNASSLTFTKHNAQIMSLCLTYRVNLGLSLRKTAQALKDIHGISISHQMVANYCRTAALCVKPFVDTYPYEKGHAFTADETYIKVRGVKGFIWFIMDAASRVIIGYQVSDNRGVGPCIMAMRMAFQHLKKLPEKFLFVADAYSAYPLAAQQFFRKFGESFKFEITQVVGLTNDDAVSKEFRPYKQMIERLNRTYKASYRPTNGFDNYDGASYDLALWVAYYNFLRPHKIHNYKRPLVENDVIANGGNMPGKWQLMIFLGQQTILKMQQDRSA
ncbi:MAG: DDE-type integrase/transposase/recombinase [Lachnospiraceae bacterium]|nr:DDE-type integrase/transposase/recombinase [Lachnospiraceae bacterium]